jgi:transposase InsO family protein
LFLAFIVDCFSRMVVGWQLAAHMRTAVVLDALRMAPGLSELRADIALVHHSDRGSHGGFNRSSQRSSERGLRLACGVDGPIELGGRRRALAGPSAGRAS